MGAVAAFHLQVCKAIRWLVVAHATDRSEVATDILKGRIIALTDPLLIWQTTIIVLLAGPPARCPWSFKIVDHGLAQRNSPCFNHVAIFRVVAHLDSSVVIKSSSVVFSLLKPL